MVDRQRTLRPAPKRQRARRLAHTADSPSSVLCARIVAPLLIAGLALMSACRSGEAPHIASDDPNATATTGSTPTVHPPTPRTPSSAGLVGPGATDVDPVEVVDVGPPAPVVLFTASLKGYTEPCGCTIDVVLGGIDRVTGFIDAARALATDALILDAGNLLFEHEALDPFAIDQEVRKAHVLMRAHREVGTLATVPGPNDFAHGVDFYLEMIGTSGMTILGANIEATGGIPLGLPHLTTTLGGETIGVIGAVDPSLYAAIEGVETRPALPEIQASATALREEGATTIILVYHGDVVSARQNLHALESVDFIIIGHEPRKTDTIEQVGSAFTLEAYDQGRYVGRLKLYTPAVDGRTEPWASARAGSQDEIERLERVIATTEARLSEMPPVAEGEEEPPVMAAQRARLDDMRAQLSVISEGDVDFEAGGRRFLYTPESMDPGLPTLASITEEMIAYNQELRAINLAHIEPIPPVPDGHPTYVGAERCATCHYEAHNFWLSTRHAHAINTLQTRDKEYDRNCIGCHVTGYREPGGSVLGNTNGLENVQCEQCHGPGSLHVMNPTLVNVPTGVQLQVPESLCASCHNEEHSPTFEYERYMQMVLGPGHGG